MVSIERLKAYWRLTRPKTAMSTALTAIGGMLYAGSHVSHVDLHIPALIVLGVTLAHFSVNALNDYMDYKSNLDTKTPRTPFSGGSKVLVDKLITPLEALAIAITSMVLAMIIGLYLTLYRGVLVLILAISGALIIVTYNNILVRIGLGEVAVWVKGILVFIGAQYVVAGVITWDAVLIGSIYGGVSTLILYANFIPDIEADRSVGRRTIPVLLGDKAWVGYQVIALVLGALLILSVTLRALNLLALLALIPLLQTPRVSKTLRDARDLKAIVEALARNTMICNWVNVIVTLTLAFQSLIL